jgi:hypothetical protein
MRVHVIREHATESEIRDMLECLGDYIKLAVDVERGVLAGGGGYHADGEAALLEYGSRQDDIWGADWYPESRTVECVALINIRPRKGNLSMEVESPNLRERISAIVRRLLE